VYYLYKETVVEVKIIENYLKQILVEDKDLKRFVYSYSVLKYRWNRKEKPKLFPLTSGHIIMNFGDGYIVKDEGKALDVKDHLIFYPSMKTLEISYKLNTYIIGIELSPQGLYYLTKGRISDNLNSILYLKEKDRELYKVIEKNRDELSKDDFKGLNEYFKERFKKYYLDEDLLLVDKVLSKISATDILIRDIAANLGVSLRTLERKFKRNTGMTIKKYQLILKLNRLLEEIYMKDDIDWGELSVKYGFFDQPHMIKELKKYLGRSPREYLKNRDLLGDIFEIDDVFLQ